jgi:hypothetical protein
MTFSTSLFEKRAFRVTPIFSGFQRFTMPTSPSAIRGFSESTAFHRLLAQKLRQTAILLRISAVNYPDQSDAIDSGTKAGDCALLICWQGRLKIAG